MSAPEKRDEPAHVVSHSAPACVPDVEQPVSGAELIKGSRGGHGVVSVDNGTSSNAVVALFDGIRRRTARRFFVRAGTIGRALSVPPGLYSIRFAFGEGFSSMNGTFCRLGAASEFDHAVALEETPTDEGIHYTEETITLHKVINGNAPSHRISPELVFADSA